MPERATLHSSNGAILSSLALCLCVLLTVPVAAQETRTPRQDAPPASAPTDSTVKPTSLPSPAEIDAAEVAIIANVKARELKFEVVPNPTVQFTGQPERETRWEAERENLPRPVQPGVTYRDVGIRLVIISRFADIERIVAEALGETPVADDEAPPANSDTPPEDTPARTIDPAASRVRPAISVELITPLAPSSSSTAAAPSSRRHQHNAKPRR